MGRHSALLASLVLAAVLLGAPAAGASSRPAGAVPASATPAAATAPPQEPDAPADDGTGGSGEESENPEPGAVDQDIIPKPNSGRDPTDAGDRGGALQVVVFVAIVAGVGSVAALAVRDVRRSRARAAGDSTAGADRRERPRL